MREFNTTRKKMLELVAEGKALDLKNHRRTAFGDYHLNSYTPELLYCDTRIARWATAIARNRITGELIASTSCNFLNNAEFDVLWT